MTEIEVLEDVQEPVNKSRRETSRLGAERDPSKSKRHKLLKKAWLKPGE
jgi:hypothetical protein